MAGTARCSAAGPRRMWPGLPTGPAWSSVAMPRCRSTTRRRSPPRPTDRRADRHRVAALPGRRPHPGGGARGTGDGLGPPRPVGAGATGTPRAGLRVPDGGRQGRGGPGPRRLGHARRRPHVAAARPTPLARAGTRQPPPVPDHVRRELLPRRPHRGGEPGGDAAALRRGRRADPSGAPYDLGFPTVYAVFSRTWAPSRSAVAVARSGSSTCGRTGSGSSGAGSTTTSTRSPSRPAATSWPPTRGTSSCSGTSSAAQPGGARPLALHQRPARARGRRPLARRPHPRRSRRAAR